MFKITNKLNGGDIRPFLTAEVDNQYAYNYQFNSPLQSIAIIPISEKFPDYFSYGGSSSGILCIFNKNSNLDNYGVVSIQQVGQTIFLDYVDIYDSYTTTPMQFMVVATDSEGNYDIDYFYCKFNAPCFVKDTLITLSDSSTKPVQDITYDDNLLVWNFDEGRYDVAKPLWIKKTQISSYYYNVVLDNGTTLKLVGSDGKCHRLFSIDDGMFISATDMVGKTTYTQNGVSKVLSCDKVEENVEFYNVITDYHINLFANGVLTSCRYNNIYPIENMRFIKGEINNEYKNKVINKFNEYPELIKYVDGLRLSEQYNIDIEDTVKYCENLEHNKK